MITAYALRLLAICFLLVSAAPSWPSKLKVSRNFHETAKGSLHYVMRGDFAVSAPLVLFHSDPRSTLEFQYFANELPASRAFIAVDYYGFGASDDCRCNNATSEFVDFPKFATEVLAILDKYEVKKFVPVGNLKGTNPALALADLAGPSRVESIVLISPLILSPSAIDYLLKKFIPSIRTPALYMNGSHVGKAWKDPSGGPCLANDEEYLEGNEDKTIDLLRVRLTRFQIQLAWVHHSPDFARTLQKVSRFAKVLVVYSPKIEAQYAAYGLDPKVSKLEVLRSLRGSSYKIESVDGACQGLMIQNATFMAHKIERFLSTENAREDSYAPWCVAKEPHLEFGQNVCATLVAQAKAIFGGTLDGNFSLVIGHKDAGRLLEAGWGMNSSSTNVIASASKWLSAAAILQWADKSKVSISKPVRNYVPWWREQLKRGDPRSAVTLEHMLSQTDGFGETLTTNFTEDGPAIFSKDYGNLATPQKIFTAVPIENYTGLMTGFDVKPSPYTWGKTPMHDLPKPGSVFYYEETHWRLAESIVHAASGRGLDDITADLARDFGMTSSHLENIPQLGGPEWISNADDLERFLLHVLRRDFLSRHTRESFERAHTRQAKWYGFRQRPDWGYAMGSWAHCPNESCKQFSSIGIFGTFPFVDHDSGIYYALVRPAGMDQKRGVFLDRSVSFWEKTYPAMQREMANTVSLLI